MIEKGFNSGWKYKKSYKGDVELIKDFDIALTSYGQFNNWYCYYYEIDLPFELKDITIFTNWIIGTGLALPSNVVSIGNNRYRMFCIASQGGGSLSTKLSVLVKGTVEV